MPRGIAFEGLPERDAATGRDEAGRGACRLGHVEAIKLGIGHSSKLWRREEGTRGGEPVSPIRDRPSEELTCLHGSSAKAPFTRLCHSVPTLSALGLLSSGGHGASRAVPRAPRRAGLGVGVKEPVTLKP